MSDGLTPNQPVSRSIQVDRQIPPCARQWGRIIDTSTLWPGDLVLVRSIKPDSVGKKIEHAHTNGGFAQRHAQWTHAAVYLGDGESICESTFKEKDFRWGVIMRSIHYYCNNETAIKVRRPKNMSMERRIGIALGAVNRLGDGYSFNEIFQFWRAARSGRGFWQGNVRQKIGTRALVCSTLYQDAYNFSMKGDTVRMGSLCTPAHLSASDDFEEIDPEINWLGIE